MLCHLPHRITILNETRTAIAGGCYTSTFVTASTEWANCQVLNNTGDKKESYAYHKKQQFTTWKVMMRADVSITNKQRIVYDSRILEVETVIDPTSRGRMQEIVCREEVV